MRPGHRKIQFMVKNPPENSKCGEQRWAAFMGGPSAIGGLHMMGSLSDRPHQPKGE
jgi:hypothetical protein